jgi:ABC-type sugar transport system permease subunit
MPVLCSVVVAGIIFRMMFSELDGAMMNQLRTLFGQKPITWLKDQNGSMFAMVLLCFWRWTGMNMLHYMAGLKSIPQELYEAATIDGAGRFRIFWSIVMPNVKPAWLTMIIFSVQGLWNTSAATVIYSEAKKTLVYALQQIQAGGIARAGQAAAVSVVVMLVPIIIFICSQNQIMETMSSSGLKD